VEHSRKNDKTTKTIFYPEKTHIVRINLNFVDLYLDLLNPHKTQKSSVMEEAEVKIIVASKNIYRNGFDT